MLLDSLLFLAGQKHCASLLGDCLLGDLQQRREDTGEIWKSDLKQWSCMPTLGVSAEISAELSCDSAFRLLQLAGARLEISVTQLGSIA